MHLVPDMLIEVLGDPGRGVTELLGDDLDVNARLPDPVRLVSASLTGAARRHAGREEPTEAETAAAVADLRKLLVGRDDAPNCWPRWQASGSASTRAASPSRGRRQPLTSASRPEPTRTWI